MSRKNKYKQLPIPKETPFIESLRGNTNTYYLFYYRMVEIYLNRFVWKGLPKSVDIPTLEYGLLMNGNVAYFRDLVMGDLCLMGTPSKRVDVYNYQIGYYIHTASGYNRHLRVSRFDPNRDGVVIYSNFMRTADIMIIMEFAQRLYEAMRVCDVNINNQKTTKIIGLPEAQRLTMINLLKDYNGHVPIILTDNQLQLGSDQFPVYDMTTPYIADKVWNYIRNIWNDFLTWCGVENGENQKRERMVMDEVNANTGNIEAERNTGLKARRIGCEEINDLFDMDASVEFNSNLDTRLNRAFVLGEENVGSGNIYSTYSGVSKLADERSNRDSLRSEDE